MTRQVKVFKHQDHATRCVIGCAIIVSRNRYPIQRGNVLVEQHLSGATLEVAACYRHILFLRETIRRRSFTASHGKLDDDGGRSSFLIT
jgi:hypothetical protein